MLNFGGNITYSPIVILQAKLCQFWGKIIIKRKEKISTLVFVLVDLFNFILIVSPAMSADRNVTHNIAQYLFNICFMTVFANLNSFTSL